MKLTPNKFAYFERFFDEVGYAVSRAAKHHNELLRSSFDFEKHWAVPGKRETDFLWFDGDISSMTSEWITVEGYDYHRYPDEACRIPMVALVDETMEAAIQKIVNDKVQILNDIVEKYKLASEAQDREEFERLKKKLEG